MNNESSSHSLLEGAAEWPATGLENRGVSAKAQGFDSSTLRHFLTTTTRT
jgi:hypothetical protein